MNVSPSSKVVRFIAVGALNTAFGYAVFAGLTMLGWPDTIALATAMAAGIAFNFFSYGKWVFALLDLQRLPRFVAAYLCIYTANLLGLRSLARLGLSAYAAQLALVVPLAALVFLLNDRWVFRES
jgi:putative flippase GtrA